MATRYRIAAGNWSNVAQWDGGTTLPGPADDVYLNNRATTLDQDVTVLSIQNGALGSPVIAAGGSLTIASPNRAIVANCICSTTVDLLILTATSGTLTITGNLTRGATGNGGRVLHLNNSVGCNVTINGNVFAGAGGVNSFGIGVTTSCGNLTVNGTAQGSTTAPGVAFGATGARTLTISTVNPNGLAVSSGTGAGHTINVSNWDNTTAGFSTAQACGVLGGIIASATINKTASVTIGTCRGWDLNQAASSGAVTLNIAAGAGDIVAPSTATSMIIVAAGAGVTTNINCRDVLGFTVGAPNGIGVIQQSSGAANTLNVNCRNVLGGTVTCTNGAATILNASASATVNVTLTSPTIGARGGITGATAGVFACCNNSTGVFNLFGTALGGTATGINNVGFQNTSSGTAFVTKAQSSGSLVNATGAHFGTNQASNAGFITVDQMEDGAGGWPASSGRHFIRAAGVNEVRMRNSNNGTIQTLGEVAADYPVETDVRDGVAYDFGALTGSLKVPPVGSVALGVPTDNTTGTAALSATAIADAVLARNLAGGSDGGRTVRDALRASRNRTALSGGTLTVYAEDDTTPAWAAAVATSARDPIASVDPA
jgi:hypothetical protein